MKPQTIFHSVFLVASLLLMPVECQDPKPIPEAEILKRLDRNEDGFLESGEIPIEMRKFIKSIIKECDADKCVDKQTGRIDLQLLQSLVQKHLEKPAEPKRQNTKKISNQESLKYAAQLISNYDSDDDQCLGASEFQKLSDKWVECDLNQDLRLDVIEVACGLKYALEFPRNPDGTFDQNKANADQELLVEIYKQMKAEFLADKAKQTVREKTDLSRQYARALVANYDKDQSGSLESSELKKIGLSWLEVDFDHDGKATVDEIQVRFQRFEAARELGDASQFVANPKSNTSKNPSVTIAIQPGDFTRFDADGDSQIEMHEFAIEFDASVIRDFYQRDISRDGVITLSEWNRFLAKQNKQSANPSIKAENDSDRK